MIRDSAELKELLDFVIAVARPEGEMQGSLRTGDGGDQGR